MRDRLVTATDGCPAGVWAGAAVQLGGAVTQTEASGALTARPSSGSCCRKAPMACLAPFGMRFRPERAAT
eukprot:9414475-Heterocapsa_arctica.AAC.1